MVTTFVNSLFHQFMAGWLHAELPAADEKRVGKTVQRNAARRREPFRNPFRGGEDGYDWRPEVPHVGAL